MGPPTPAEDVSSALRSQIRECFGRVVYSQKTHEKAADGCLAKLRRIKLSQILLSALTTSGLIVTIFGSPSVSQVSAICSALLSTGLLALNTYTKDADPGQSAEKHREAAAKLWDIREAYLSLLTDMASEALSDSAVRDRRDDLQKRLAATYSGAPRTTTKAYAAASDGLKTREELTFTDDEIDQFLPGPLRSRKASSTALP